MPDFSDLLEVEPRTPSPMRQLLNEEPPPEAVIPSDQLFAKYLHDLSPVNSPDTFSIDLEPQEPAESSLNLNSTLFIQEKAPLYFTSSTTDNQEPAESSLNLNSTVPVGNKNKYLEGESQSLKNFSEGEVLETASASWFENHHEGREMLFTGWYHFRIKRSMDFRPANTSTNRRVCRIRHERGHKMIDCPTELQTHKSMEQEVTDEHDETNIKEGNENNQDVEFIEGSADGTEIQKTSKN
ncbi:unnamed protein product [Mytilus coruscus]|uniref:Uncharacterized protein n=1 Tax=Mytilus coruscus TaxID=42192 RepID=A0A6J8AF69_MYTCO|nr:unnamed protein product [Mytilus coruscus]